MTETASRALTFSPSDLTAYLECHHLARLELEVKRRERARPVVENLHAELTRHKGEEHEAAYLQRVLDEGRDVVRIELGEFEWERAASETEDALRAGREILYQATFVDGAWRGIADFVVRQPDGFYEAVDTKLARHGKPAHVLQLCFYSEQIGRITGRMPQRMHIALGSGETESYRVNDFLAYFRRVRARYEPFAADPPHTEPYPVRHCPICDFLELCTKWWEEQDQLPRVARMRRDQVARLGDAGITTLAKLGSQPRGTEIPRMAATTSEALRHQAELQLHAHETGEHRHELLPPEEKRGFHLLPKPSEDDLFFDMEGDPFWEPSITGRSPGPSRLPPRQPARHQADHRLRGLRHRRPPLADQGLRPPDPPRGRQRRLERI
jgi:predicted RecB family nuclease